MTRATAILRAGEPLTLAPAANISFEIEAGDRFEFTQPEGEQVADLISFNRDNVRRCCRCIQAAWSISTGN